MKEIELAIKWKKGVKNKGLFVLVDDDIFDKFKKWNWNLGEGYAQHRLSKKEGFKLVKMHRLIMNAPKGVEVDHIDGNRLNNQKQNLRFASHGQNNQNRPKMHKSTNTSKYKGVGWMKSHQLWRARIKHYHLGLFKTETEAAKAYDIKAKELFREFSHLNFP